MKFTISNQYLPPQLDVIRGDQLHGLVALGHIVLETLHQAIIGTAT